MRAGPSSGITSLLYASLATSLFLVFLAIVGQPISSDRGGSAADGQRKPDGFEKWYSQLTVGCLLVICFDSHCCSSDVQRRHIFGPSTTQSRHRFRRNALRDYSYVVSLAAALYYNRSYQTSTPILTRTIVGYPTHGKYLLVHHDLPPRPFFLLRPSGESRGIFPGVSVCWQAFIAFQLSPRRQCASPSPLWCLPGSVTNASELVAHPIAFVPNYGSPVCTGVTFSSDVWPSSIIIEYSVASYPFLHSGNHTIEYEYTSESTHVSHDRHSFSGACHVS